MANQWSLFDPLVQLKFVFLRQKGVGVEKLNDKSKP